MTVVPDTNEMVKNKTVSDVPENEDLGAPLDPTTNPQSFMGDTYGLNGMTVDLNGGPNPSSILQPGEDPRAGMVPPSSDRVSEKIKKQGEVDRDEVAKETRVLDALDDGSNNTLHAGSPPHVVGEQSLSGDMTDPEADDDMLAASHQVGLRLDEDSENPQELDIAGDVAATERDRRGLGDFDLD